MATDKYYSPRIHFVLYFKSSHEKLDKIPLRSQVHGDRKLLPQSIEHARHDET